MFVDSHTHLDMETFDDDRNTVIEKAFESGVEKILNVGFDLASSRNSVELAEKYDCIYAAVGVHPHNAKSYDDTLENLLAELAKHRRVLAIGEIGLDYHYDNSPRDKQKDVFIRQLRLAEEMRLPVLIHSRDAMDDVIEILRDNIPARRGVVHCFSGSEEDARTLIGMGFLLAFGGTVTFKKNQNAQKLFRAVQVEKMLIETDCPYLAPAPFRGKRNEPAYVVNVAKKIAEMKGLSVRDVARITTDNFKTLFSLDLGRETVIAYPIRNSLYLNITSRCTNGCGFCARNTSYTVKGHFLHLEQEPSVDEILAAADEMLSRDNTAFDEVVFCGFGEPLMRLDEVISVAKVLKKRGLKVRINTNGHANLIAGSKVAEKFRGIIDAVSISLNAQDSKTYAEICKPSFGEGTYKAVIDFIKDCKEVIPSVTVTAVDMPGVDMERCKTIAKELGVDFRARSLNNVG